MKRKIIILGHRGFIGHSLYHPFSQNPHFETLGFSSQEINLLDKDSVEHCASHWDEKTVLVLCSAIGRAKQDDADSFLKNILFVQHLANVLKDNPVGHCLFLSSIDVYGKPSCSPLNEKVLPAPDSYYGLAKYAGEFLLQKALEGQKTVLTILRLSGVYGIGEKSAGPVDIWMKTALREGKINLFGDGSEHRDYVWVEDLYPLFCRLIDKKAGGIFNIVTGKSYSLLEIIDQMREVIQKPFEVIRSERKRPWLDYRFDGSRLEKTVGPFPWTPLTQGLKTIYASYQH